MQDTQKDRDHCPDEPPPLPEYDISPSLKKVVLLCIGIMLINFLIAGACAIAVRRNKRALTSSKCPTY